MTETLSGTLLGGRYRVGALLGQGGMGAVYEGMQEGLDRRVALKVLHNHLATEKDLISRFKREAHAVATLGHPNVVQISDFQANAGEPPFLVMELLHGESLRDLLKRRGQLPPERVAYIFQQVLAALEAAHAKDIVHRDIKPDNVFLCATSVQADLVKILDFGVAKILRQEDPNVGKLTKNGFVVGTLSYMAPEQATGDPIDGRADLYSVGACMYLALTGRKPYDAPSTPLLLKAILTETHVPLAAVRQDIDLALAAIVDRALSKKPSDRFANAREMASALSVFAKPTPLEPSASEAPTLPRDDSPATVGPKRVVPSGAPTMDAKALARSAPTAQQKAIPAPVISDKPTAPTAGAGKKTLLSPGTVPPSTPPSNEPRMSSTPPPHSMGPDTLATLQFGAHPEEPPPDTEPPQAIGEGARAPNVTSPMMTTVRSRTQNPPAETPVAPPAESPMTNVSTTLKMKPAAAAGGPTVIEPGPPEPPPAVRPARVQVPVAPTPAPVAVAVTPAPGRPVTPPMIVSAPRTRAPRSSTSSILLITFFVLFAIAVVALGVGIYAMNLFPGATQEAPAGSTEPTATVPSTSTTASVTVAAPPPSAGSPNECQLALDLRSAQPDEAEKMRVKCIENGGSDPFAAGTSMTKPRSTGMGSMAASAGSQKAPPAVSVNPTLAGATSAIASAIASSAPSVFGTAAPLLAHPPGTPTVTATSTSPIPTTTATTTAPAGSGGGSTVRRGFGF